MIFNGLFDPFPGLTPYTYPDLIAPTPEEWARFVKHRSQEERIGYPDLAPYVDPGLISALPTGGGL